MRTRFLWSRVRWIGLTLIFILGTLSFGLHAVIQQIGSDTAVATKIAKKHNLDEMDSRIPVSSSRDGRRKFSQSAPSSGRFVTSHAPAAANNSTEGPRNASTLAYEFVVAHYNEKLDWLKPIANRSHVYHKGKDKRPPFDVYKWEELPNVGREPHTFLYHIIANYDNLADLTVFLHGHGTYVDKGYCFPKPTYFLTNAKNNLFCIEKPPIRTWGRLNHFGKWLSALRKGKMRKARFTLGEFYEAVFGAKHPETAPKCLAGCFSATREMIRQHPVSLYQRAIFFVDNHSNPEESHYMERLWASIIYLI
ncbi:uncharacterized protein LOC119726035 [Patiria miniata]|uniref:Uncharacterized protein n=1 Tax=Patiria miniata TaxID=46514 RepID=A0A913ZP67_PATMI|nr:uncharacterized protein LOC119726035 [Patiria miniata]